MLSRWIPILDAADVVVDSGILFRVLDVEVEVVGKNKT